MQTFLPYPDFAESARVLDRQRLGKQRIECYQIIRTLTGETSGWNNHPAIKMWKGYCPLLRYYMGYILVEWHQRGYVTSCKLIREAYPPYLFSYIGRLPQWLGTEAFHASHRSNLLRKNPDHYQQFGWKEPDNLPYVWPV